VSIAIPFDHRQDSPRPNPLEDTLGIVPERFKVNASHHGGMKFRRTRTDRGIFSGCLYQVGHFCSIPPLCRNMLNFKEKWAIEFMKNHLTLLASSIYLI
jgi:hypothetical protein